MKQDTNYWFQDTDVKVLVKFKEYPFIASERDQMYYIAWKKKIMGKSFC